jgi:hypothetical protein
MVASDRIERMKRDWFMDGQTTKRLEAGFLKAEGAQGWAADARRTVLKNP